MEIKDWLKSSIQQLVDNKIVTARLDCLVLLEDEIKKDRGWILAHPEYILQIEQLKVLSKKIVQRGHHIPIAYIRRTSEFYGRDFYVDSHVLVPRPESEALIELLKSVQNSQDNVHQKLFRIIDIGTGSGALAITAQLEIPSAEVIGVDIDSECLKVACRSAKAYDCPITLLQGNLFEPIMNIELELRQTILLCNLPYVPNDFEINTAAKHEPQIALFGGVDGLDLFRILFKQLSHVASPPDYVITESLPVQHTKLTTMARNVGYELLKTDDFAQLYMIAPA